MKHVAYTSDQNFMIDETMRFALLVITGKQHDIYVFKIVNLFVQGKKFYVIDKLQGQNNLQYIKRSLRSQS